MVQEIPFFDVALNLPHAGRVARRIATLFQHHSTPLGGASANAVRTVREIVLLLDPWADQEDNPPPDVTKALRVRAAELGRELVEHIESGHLGHDRLGQCARNFFECLELGREGASISLRAGENPRSFQRPI